jgi:hypothetical protein
MTVRLVALVAATVLGLAGCGDSDGESRSTGEPAMPKADSGQVGNLVVVMYNDFAANDEAGVCGVLTTEAREEVARDATGSGDATCEDGLDAFFDAEGSSRAVHAIAKTAVNRVRFDGPTALVSISLRGHEGIVRLVPEHGQWHVTALEMPAGSPL